MTVVVMHQNRMQRDHEIGRVFIAPMTLEMGEVEAWYPISNNHSSLLGTSFHDGLKTEEPLKTGGDIKLRLKYEEVTILALKHYQDLFSVR